MFSASCGKVDPFFTGVARWVRNDDAPVYRIGIGWIPKVESTFGSDALACNGTRVKPKRRWKTTRQSPAGSRALRRGLWLCRGPGAPASIGAFSTGAAGSRGPLPGRSSSAGCSLGSPCASGSASSCSSRPTGHRPSGRPLERLRSPASVPSSCAAAYGRCPRRLPLPRSLPVSLPAPFGPGSVAAPVLNRVVIAPLTGFIEAVEDREEGQRLLLRLVELKDGAQTERPRLVRVSVRKGAQLSAGQFVAGTARLLPPPEAAWPGGYDFARDAYYKGIGAVGSMVGQVRVLEPAVKPDWTLQLAAQVDAARNALTQRIASAIGGPAGGVGAALVTGKRGLIPEPTNDVLRGAGIYHIVSISGLHMVLAAGTFFWLVRALLALAPAFALLWPVKKIAAVAAMVGATIYCIFSGSDVATERSLIMTLVMFGAVLVDRPALSIRNLSIAALIVLAREPEALAGAELPDVVRRRCRHDGARAADASEAAKAGPRPCSSRSLHWSGQAMLGLVTTTLVASIATAPFSAYHFQSAQPLRPYRQRARPAARLACGHALGRPRRAGLSVRPRPAGLAADGSRRRAGARGVRLGRRLQRIDARGAGSEHRRSGASEPRRCSC